ncbi:hypothetical protein [Streptomyces sp. I05A-00742]|uniref:hypothetical protein n=1 Tax=Streptomyces sp. I05A-00742 TaxID=2732853 RepID=UPI0014876401|nr:hypothetical protein [Streptomyces sp. I05A-00742]
MDDDDALEELVEEFSNRRIYRPTDGGVEPDEVPQGPSGTAMDSSPGAGAGSAEPDAP